jgi:hypothetical protein
VGSRTPAKEDLRRVDAVVAMAAGASCLLGMWRRENGWNGMEGMVLRWQGIRRGGRRPQISGRRACLLRGTSRWGVVGHGRWIAGNTLLNRRRYFARVFGWRWKMAGGRRAGTVSLCSALSHTWLAVAGFFSFAIVDVPTVVILVQSTYRLIGRLHNSYQDLYIATYLCLVGCIMC